MTLEAGLPRRHDEHASVPTWRLRQLQLIEDAAREAVEILAKRRRNGVFEQQAIEVKALLEDALESHQ